MRGSLSTFLSLVPLVLSTSLALLTVLYSPLASNVTLLLILAAAGLLALGVFGLYFSSKQCYAASIGGQMAWACCALALQGASVVLIWSMFFVQLALLFTGIRGMWLSGHAYRKNEGGWPGPIVKELLAIYEWLGAAALVSGAVLLLAPLLRTGIGLVILAALCILIIMSFAFLARKSVAIVEASETSNEKN